mgnify:FL=1
MVRNTLLPHLLAGLKSSSAEYRIATYMIVSQLATRVSLSEPTVARFLSLAIEHAANSLREALLCVVALTQSQPHLKQLPAVFVQQATSNRYVFASVLSMSDSIRSCVQ